jgi:hypothetical protein
MCLNSVRYIYEEAVFNLTGGACEFTDASNVGLQGKQIAINANGCAGILAKGAAEDKAKCRGPMKSDCANRLDALCGSGENGSNLTGVLAGATIGAAALPPDCDSSVAGYSDTNCLNWVGNQFILGGLVFNPSGVTNLPANVAASTGVSVSSSTITVNLLRYLSYTTTTVVSGSSDPTSTDTKAQVVASASTVSDSDVTVDSSTKSSAASPSTYISGLSESAAKNSSSIAKVGLSLMIAIAFILF